MSSQHPPHSEYAETAIIGAVLLHPELAADATSLVDKGEFYREEHRIIWGAIEDLVKGATSPDVVSVSARLQATGLDKRAGGATKLSEVIDAVPDTTNVPYYAKLVRDFAGLRTLQDASRKILAEKDPTKAIEQLQVALEAATGRDLTGSLERAPEIAKRVIDRAGSIVKDGVRGVRTGFPIFDKMVTSLAPGQFTIIAARPSVGKSALATTLATNASLRQGKTVLFVSLEMTNDEVVQRVLGNLAEVDTTKFLTGDFSPAGVPNDYERLDDAVKLLESSGLWINDSSGLSVPQVRSIARKVRAISGSLDLIVIDYLQLMDGPGHSREEKIGNISQGIKGLAKDLGVHAIALAQLNRSPVKEGRRERPELSDLRESGRLEQDADKVAFLVRAENDQAAQLQLAKNRQGPTGDVPLRFIKETTAFIQGDWGDFVEDEGGPSV